MHGKIMGAGEKATKMMTTMVMTTKILIDGDHHRSVGDGRRYTIVVGIKHACGQETSARCE